MKTEHVRRDYVYKIICIDICAYTQICFCIGYPGGETIHENHIFTGSGDGGAESRERFAGPRVLSVGGLASAARPEENSC